MCIEYHLTHTKNWKVEVMSIESRPNLFDFATSELSQDAMICWLLACADSTNKDRKLQQLGKKFWETLLNHKQEHKQPIKLGGEVHVCVHKQVNNIDVLAQVNDQHVLLIEDKTDTGPKGNNQLKQYYETVKSGKSVFRELGGKSLYPIFLKTGNYSMHEKCVAESIELGGYKVFNRKDFLDVLGGYNGENAIVLDFRRRLQYLEYRTHLWGSWRKGDWEDNWWGHQGLLCRLEEDLNADENCEWINWGYVPNRSGGFLGLWWQSKRVKKNTSDDVYLQLESDKLCFKVGAGDHDDRQKLKWNWHDRLMVGHSDLVEKPPRMRVGETMTVGHWIGGWMQFGKDGVFDLEATFKVLVQAEEVLFAASRVGD